MLLTTCSLWKKIACAMLMIALPFLPSCNKPKASSDTKALTIDTPACKSYSLDAYRTLEKDLQATPEFFRNFAYNGIDNPENKETLDLLRHLYLVPKVYRDFLVRLHQEGRFKGIYARDLGKGVEGLTFTDGTRPSTISLNSKSSSSISFALIHEVGHAVEGFVRDGASKSKDDWKKDVAAIFDEGSKLNKSGKVSGNQKLRVYALSGPGEYFAEAFHNYYCSPETHAYIEKNLPATYAFFKRHAAAPVWAQGQP